MCSGEEDTKTAGASSDAEQGRGDSEHNTLSRRFSAESQEFEFNKPVSGYTSPLINEDQIRELGEGLAAADELFYKGQLLPLQYNTRATAFASSVASSPTSPWHDTIELLPTTKLSLSSLTRDQDVRFSSCRMDHVSLDSSLFELTRSSSFRAHSSYDCNYYANYAPKRTEPLESSATTSCAGETTSSSSSSGSRDSNGSSQDSCSSSDHHKEQRVGFHVHTSGASVNGPFSPFPRRKPGLMQSWKIFFNGLRRTSSHPTPAGGYHEAHHKSSVGGGLSGRAGANPHGADDQGSKSTVGKSKTSREMTGLSERHIMKSSASKPSLLWAQEKEMGRCDGIQNNGRDDQSTSSFTKKDKEFTRRGSFLRDSKWLGYTRRIKPINILRATLVGGHSSYGDKSLPESCTRIIREQQSQAPRDSARAAWPALKGRGGTTQMSSLERRPSVQPSFVSTVISGAKGPSKVLFRFHTVSSSCPASVRSSPNHSGLLVASPANRSGPLTSPAPAFNNNMSTMQELHSAVQGAIAHCKQSISTHP